MWYIASMDAHVVQLYPKLRKSIGSLQHFENMVGSVEIFFGVFIWTTSMGTSTAFSILCGITNKWLCFLQLI